VAEPTFDCPDLDAFCLIDRMGLTVTGQLVGEDHTVLACRVLEPDNRLYDIRRGERPLIRVVR